MTEIFARMEPWEVKRYKSLQMALKALQEGRAYRLAFPAEHPASGWGRVEADDQDSSFVWISQTDVNSVTNRAWAATSAVRMKVTDLMRTFKEVNSQ